MSLDLYLRSKQALIARVDTSGNGLTFEEFCKLVALQESQAEEAGSNHLGQSTLDTCASPAMLIGFCSGRYT